MHQSYFKCVHTTCGCPRDRAEDSLWVLPVCADSCSTGTVTNRSSPQLQLITLLGLVKPSTFTETCETEHEHFPDSFVCSFIRSVLSKLSEDTRCKSCLDWWQVFCFESLYIERLMQGKACFKGLSKLLMKSLTLSKELYCTLSKLFQFWRRQPSGILLRVVSLTFTDVSKMLTASIIRALI
jgi:hypothetical protein